IILDKQFQSKDLTIQVDTLEKGKGVEFFVMSAEAESISSQYLADTRIKLIQWTLDYENRVVKDGDKVIFKVKDHFTETRPKSGPKQDASLRGLWFPIRSAFAQSSEVPRLIMALRSDNPSVRRNARDALTRIGLEGVKPMMIAWRQASSDYRVTLGVVYALNSMLRDDTTQNRMVAKELTDDDIKLLVNVVSDEDKTTRLQATEF